MFNREIEFTAPKEYFELKQDYPIPTKLNIPEWYKKLEHTVLNKTVKGCMPFLDTLTAGYLLKMPQDFFVRHNIDNKDKNQNIIKDSFQTFALHNHYSFLKEKKINLNSGIDIHSIEQVFGSPFVEINKNLPFYKINNPWKIKTPKGYSCLFVPPLNNSDDRFSIIPGIVDTDNFPLEINFPIILNGIKYPVLETIIKRGTPYVQVIPFKRDSWKMIIKSTKEKEKEIEKNNFFFYLNVLNNYKQKYWDKKLWK
jgi:hypothetical protein